MPGSKEELPSYEFLTHRNGKDKKKKKDIFVLSHLVLG